jgi:GNAT superfamily N-acetyltransferase
MHALRFRDAVPTDARAIADFQLAMALETEGVALHGPTTLKGVQAVIANAALGRYVLAERDVVIVGSLLLTLEWSDWRNGEYWWIQSVYVAPESRRAGVFKGLYAHVKSMAEANPAVRGLRLYVDRRNTAAQRVYAGLGMDGDHYQVFEWMKPGV